MLSFIKRWYGQNFWNNLPFGSLSLIYYFPLVLCIAAPSDEKKRHFSFQMEMTLAAFVYGVSRFGFWSLVGRVKCISMPRANRCGRALDLRFNGKNYLQATTWKQGQRHHWCTRTPKGNGLRFVLHIWNVFRIIIIMMSVTDHMHADSLGFFFLFFLRENGLKIMQKHGARQVLMFPRLSN